MKFDPGPFVDRTRAQNEEERKAIRARADAALQEARGLAARILRNDPEVRSVILFGSLAEGGPKRPDFDIDLALEGGDPYKAMDVTEDCAFDVDVAVLDRLPPHVRNRIGAKGIVLASRADP
jgi:predicted nucleotidyltransferase